MRTQSPTVIGPDQVPPRDAAGELAADLARLRELIAEAPIAEARAFVSELQQRWPQSAEVQHFVRVLAPPVVRRVSPTGPRPKVRDREFAWLREHGAEHPGCWLAVLDDELVAADPQLRVVIEKVRATPGKDQALLHFEPRRKKIP
jgi:hypothetical protein